MTFLSFITSQVGGRGKRREVKVDSRSRQRTADQWGGGHFGGGPHLESLLYLHTNFPLCSLWPWAVGAHAGINKLLPEVYSQPLLHQRELDKPFFWQLRNSREGADLFTLRKVVADQAWWEGTNSILAPAEGGGCKEVANRKNASYPYLLPCMLRYNQRAFFLYTTVVSQDISHLKNKNGKISQIRVCSILLSDF